MFRNMAIPSVLVLLIVSVMAAASHISPKELYTSRYDHINIRDILKNDRLLKKYFDCLMDRGPCTPDALELKKHIPDALQTNCSKCTEKQKEGTRIVIFHLMEHKPELWKELEAKWDPKGEFVKRLKEEQRKRI